MKRIATILIVLVPLTACSRTSDGTVELKMAPLSLPALPRLKAPDLTGLWSRGSRAETAQATFPEAPPEPAMAQPVSAAPANAKTAPARARKPATRRKAARAATPAVQPVTAERTPVCGKAVQVDGRVRVDCS